jgi:hypothetical protein
VVISDAATDTIFEVVMIRGRSGDVLTSGSITDRGLEGTTPRIWAVGSIVRQVPTAQFIEALQGERWGDATGQTGSAAAWETAITAAAAYSTVRVMPGDYLMERGLFPNGGAVIAPHVTLICEGVRIFQTKWFLENLLDIASAISLTITGLKMFGEYIPRVEATTTLTVMSGSSPIGTLADAPFGGQPDATRWPLNANGHGYFWGRDRKGNAGTGWWLSQSGTPGPEDCAIIGSEANRDIDVPQAAPVLSLGTSTGVTLGFHYIGYAWQFKDGTMSGISPLARVNITVAKDVNIAIPVAPVGAMAAVIYVTKANQSPIVANLIRLAIANPQTTYNYKLSDTNLTSPDRPVNCTIILPGQIAASPTYYPANVPVQDGARTITWWVQRLTPANSNPITIGTSVDISTITGTGLTRIITTVSAHGIPTGTWVSIEGVAVSGFNRDIEATSINATQLQVTYWQDPGTYTSGGTVYRGATGYRRVSYTSDNPLNNGIRLQNGVQNFKGYYLHIESFQGNAINNVGGFQSGMLLEHFEGRACGNSSAPSCSFGAKYTVRHFLFGESGLSGWDAEPEGPTFRSADVTMVDGVIRNWGEGSNGIHLPGSTDAQNWPAHLRYQIRGVTLQTFRNGGPFEGGARQLYGNFIIQWMGWNDYTALDKAILLAAYECDLDVIIDRHAGIELRKATTSLVTSQDMDCLSFQESGTTGTLEFKNGGFFAAVGQTIECTSGSGVGALSRSDWLITNVVVGTTTVVTATNVNTPVRTGLSRVGQGSMSAGGNILTATHGNFTGLSVNDPIRVAKAAGGNNSLITTIQSITDSTHVVLAASATVAVTDQLWITPDTAGTGASLTFNLLTETLTSQKMQVRLRYRGVSDPESLITVLAANSHVDLALDNGDHRIFVADANGVTAKSGWIGILSGAPTTGTYIQGAGGFDPTTNKIWMCTVSGTPGTWKSVTLT